MATIGYAQLISRLSLVVRPLAKPAEVSGSVNRRVDSADRVLFPRGVAIEDTLVGHLEFALRHEGVNLEVIDALFEHLPPQDLLALRARRGGSACERTPGEQSLPILRRQQGSGFPAAHDPASRGRRDPPRTGVTERLRQGLRAAGCRVRSVQEGPVGLDPHGAVESGLGSLRGGESSISICLPTCWTVLKTWCGSRLGSSRRTVPGQGRIWDFCVFRPNVTGDFANA